MPKLLDERQPRIAIIGAGIGGLSTAISLKRQLNYDNFLIFERAGNIGGTWRDNIYPGCSCDIPAHWYSLSTDLNPNWSGFFVPQAEILAYWHGLVEKYSLQEHIVANTNVKSADWNDDTQNYRLTLQNQITGETWEELAEVLFNATGSLVTPLFPKDIPGRETFNGSLFHSAEWRQDIELKGKKSELLGVHHQRLSYSLFDPNPKLLIVWTRTQLVPRVSEDPSVQLVNFIRSPSWIFPRPNFKYPPWIKWVFTNIPLVMRLYRAYLATLVDIRYRLYRKSNKKIRSRFEELVANYISIAAPKRYHSKLMPDYPPGCKRLIVDPGYYEALHRPNVSLNWDGIESIVPDGILTKKGELIPLDVIVFATGFNATRLQLAIKGENGSDIEEFFARHGGQIAYLGTTIPGFPNYFVLMGPNTGQSSVLFLEEAQINYALKFIRPIISRKVKYFDVLPSAFEKYNAMIDRRIGGSVFGDCSSWYHTGKGGRNFVNFPGPITLFWLWTLIPKWDDYYAHGAAVWKRERTWTTRRKYWILAAISGAILIAIRQRM